MDTTITTLKGETGRDARRRIRAGTNLAPTSGMAPGFVQGNLAILPKAFAADLAASAAFGASGARGALVSLGGDIAVAGAAPRGGWRCFGP